MKYLKRFNESDNLLGRRGIALSIRDILNDFITEFQDETDDFKVYVRPFEIYDLETEKIIKCTNKSIAKYLKNYDGWVSVIFDLEVNNVSSDFENIERKEIISKIKNSINHIKTYFENQGYQTGIYKKEYSDFDKKTKTHKKGHWHQNIWNTAIVERLDWAESIKISIKEKTTTDN